jgi:hypothetical protein
MTVTLARAMRRWQLALVTAAICGGLTLAVVAMAGPPKAGAGYSGQTSQDRRVSFRVTPQGDLIRRFRIVRELICRKGKRRTGLTGRFTQSRLRIRVTETGGFHGEAQVTGRGNSRIRSGKVCIRGTFDRGGRRVRGRYRETVRLRDGSLCRTNLVRFIARTRS